MVTIKVKGQVEAITTKPGREGLKVDGEWFDATPRTVQYVKSRKAGDMVYLEVDPGNKIAFCGDLKPDDPDKVPKIAQTAPKTAPNSPKQALDGQSQPLGARLGYKPNLALSQTDRLIIAQVCQKGAIEVANSIIAVSYRDGNPAQLEEIAASMVDRLARRMEADFYKRVSA